MKFQPRFSLRTLVIMVTLVGAYFAAWQPTKVFGIPKVNSRGLGQSSVPVTSPAPLLIRSIEYDRNAKAPFRIRYHLWLFGIVYTFPFDREWTDPMIFTGLYSPLELQEKQRETGGRVHFEQ